MAWLMGALALIFGYISFSMFVAAFREDDPAERYKLMRSGFGTLVLTLMGIVFAWSSLLPELTPPPGQ